MSKNDITGDSIISKPSQAYSDNYDAIFRKPKVEESEKETATPKDAEEKQ